MMLVNESEEHKMWRKHSKTPVVFFILFPVEIKSIQDNRVNKRGNEIVQAEVSLTFLNQDDFKHSQSILRFGCNDAVIVHTDIETF